MNGLHKKRIVVEYWAWEPFDHLVKADEDELLGLLKLKKILSHCGYVKMRFEDVTE